MHRCMDTTESSDSSKKLSFTFKNYTHNTYAIAARTEIQYAHSNKYVSEAY